MPTSYFDIFGILPDLIIWKEERINEILDFTPQVSFFGSVLVLVELLLLTVDLSIWFMTHSIRKCASSPVLRPPHALWNTFSHVNEILRTWLVCSFGLLVICILRYVAQEEAQKQSSPEEKRALFIQMQILNWDWDWRIWTVINFFIVYDFRACASQVWWFPCFTRAVSYCSGSTDRVQRSGACSCLSFICPVDCDGWSAVSFREVFSLFSWLAVVPKMSHQGTQHWSLEALPSLHSGVQGLVANLQVSLQLRIIQRWR